MKRIREIRASGVRVGDVVRVLGSVFRVQYVLRGGGRVTFITENGLPVEFTGYERVSVLR